MPKILIIGATGYLGQTLALTLLRSGNHQVYGIARTESKAQLLARLEITPILCPDIVSDPKPFLAAIRDHNISVVVACGADAEAAKVLEAIISAGTQRLQAYANEGILGPKLGFMYTSGTWVHGSSAEPVSDLDIAGSGTLSANKSPGLVAWRPAMEQQVLKAKEILDVTVMRPALIYGRSSAIWKTFFDPVLEAAKTRADSVKIPLSSGHPSLVHVDDVAEGLNKAIDKLPLFSGTGVYPVFDLAGQTESMQDVFDAFAVSVGYEGKVELVGPGSDAFAEAMSTSGNVDYGRAKGLLGWQPRRTGFVQGMGVYGRAFVAF